MTLDCDELNECVDLLHQAASKVMDEAQTAGPFEPDYRAKLLEVVALEEAAADLESKLVELC